MKTILLLCVLFGNLITRADNSNLTATHTLPVLYINVDDGKEIVSKEDYLWADYWLDASVDASLESIGSEMSPRRLQIRGRGQSTWTRWEKKPYKIKLETNEKLLGLSKNKHYALLPNAEDRSLIKNFMGFELSKQIGIKWTPSTIPVELVLNGQYWGIYFVTENIRVSKNRVNIVEQNDYETNPDSITGGWLLEIDNYEESNQIRFNDGDGFITRVTYHSPENLSGLQKDYLESLFQKINNAIYSSDKTSTEWEDYIDIHSLAQYYVCMELMDHIESFCGSCWMYKEIGAEEKIHFGPVWDFGVCYQDDRECFIYENSPYPQHWIGEIMKFPKFQSEVKLVFNQFVGGAKIESAVDSLIDKINIAAIRNYERWPRNAETDLRVLKSQIFNRFYKKLDFLQKQWNNNTNVSKSKDDVIRINDKELQTSINDVVNIKIVDLLGKVISQHSELKNVYINSKGFFIIDVEGKNGRKESVKMFLE